MRLREKNKEGTTERPYFTKINKKGYISEKLLFLSGPSQGQLDPVPESPSILAHFLLNFRRKQEICILCKLGNWDRKWKRILQIFVGSHFR